MARGGRAGSGYFDSIVNLRAIIDHHSQPTEMRDIIVHMIEGYARHVDHADLLRECIDWRTAQ